MNNDELEKAVIDYILDKNLVPPQQLIQAKTITRDTGNLIYEVILTLLLLF